jgi:argininosuccinate lyase
MRLTAQGVPFRDAYKHVGQNLDIVAIEDPKANILSKTHVGATGNLNTELITDALAEIAKWIKTEDLKWNNVMAHLLGILTREPDKSI